jgi:hypothetical protein
MFSKFYMCVCINQGFTLIPSSNKEKQDFHYLPQLDNFSSRAFIISWLLYTTSRAKHMLMIMSSNALDMNGGMKTPISLECTLWQ